MVLPRLTVLDGRYAIGRALEASQPLTVAYQVWNLYTEDQVVLHEFFPASLVQRAEGSLEVELIDPDHEELLRYGCDQFLKETAVLAALDHPNLMQALDHFEAHGTAYRVLEHHKGATLASVLEKQGGKLPPKTGFTILLPVLDALHAAHQKGLIHGAFSPKAVFLAKGRGPLLHGFRTTHIMLAQRTGDRQLLVEDGISAPEQYDAAGRQGPWTDIYGSAATLFQMLAGDVLPAASQRLEHDDVPDLLEHADLPKSLCDLLEQALSLDSARRPRSAQAFRQQLIEALKKKAEPVVSASPAPETPEPEAEAPPSESVEAAVEPAEAVAAETPVDDEAPAAVVDETPAEAEPVVVEQEETAPVEEDLEAVAETETPEAAEKEAQELIAVEEEIEVPVAVEEEVEAPVAVEEEVEMAVAVEEEADASVEFEVVSVVEEREDEAAEVMAAQAARAQAGKADKPHRRPKLRLRRSAHEAVGAQRRGVPVLAALAVVVLIALAGAYVLTQDNGSEVAQFSYFKAQGDSLFAMTNYIEAKNQYEKALAVLPDNEYVASRLGETQQLLAEVQDVRYHAFLKQGEILYALGDSLLEAGNAREALSSFAEANKAFYEALRYRPNDPDALEKDRLTSEGMEKAVSQNQQQNGQADAAEAEPGPDVLRQQLYTSYRQQGDELFALDEYVAAREKYSKALETLPRDPYASSKIAEIDTLLAANEREVQFAQLLAQGASLNQQGRYAEARNVFRQAQQLKPGDVQAYSGFSYADSMLTLAESDKQYRRYRDEGDSLMRQNKHDEAIASYQQALFYKPGDAYARQRIQEIQGLTDVESGQPQEQIQQQTSEPEEQPGPAANVPEDGIYTVVDEAPELIGGLKELHSKVNYPDNARRRGIEGRVYVQFVLTEEGTVEDAEVIRGIGGGCDEEALRVVREARFVPGKIGGKPVRVRHTLFITFKLK